MKSNLLTSVPACPICGVGCLHGYERTAGTELAAAAAWREIAKTAMGSPRLAMLLGAASVACLLDSFDVDGIAVHACDPRGDEEAVARLVMSVCGDTQSLLGTWDESPTFIAHRARSIGSRPLGLIGEPTQENISAATSNRGVVISAGPRPILNPNVMMLIGPIAPRDELPLLQELAVRHCGWPSVWIKANPRISEATRWFELAMQVLEDKVPDANMIHRRRLAACAVGFGHLAATIGRGFGFYAGIGAALRVTGDVHDPSVLHA